MDIQLFFLFIAAALGASALGYLFKSKGLGGIGAVVFVVMGLALVNTGVDVWVQTNTTHSVAAYDSYLYDWNATFNSSTVANITSSINNTVFQDYQYTNYWNDYTNVLSVLLIGIGLIVGFEAIGRP